MIINTKKKNRGRKCQKEDKGIPTFPCFSLLFSQTIFFTLMNIEYLLYMNKSQEDSKKSSSTAEVFADFSQIVFCPQCWPFWIFFRNSKGVGGGGRKIVNALNEMAAYTSNLILLTH